MIKRYKLFTTPTCPSCPAVKKHMLDVDLEGENVDASTPQGGMEAGKYGITSVPTVLFVDDKNAIVARAQSIQQVNQVLNAGTH